MQHEPNTDAQGNPLPGYRAYNGHVFNQSDCDRYNARTRDVERLQGYPEGLERALNARHKTFCLITGCNG
jgi:hypothetical protein